MIEPPASPTAPPRLEATTLTPPPASPDPPRRRPIKLVRWRGLIPLSILLALLGIAWLLLGDRFVRETVEDVGTDLLGTQVDVGALTIREGDAIVEMRNVTIADPFDPRRNLADVEDLTIVLDPRALLERKLVIERLSVRGVRVGTERVEPARPVARDGFAPSALAEVRRWRSQFDVPLLKLTPIDTIRSIVLDPTQLRTVQAAIALRGRADSVQQALTAGYEGLRLQETYDSTEALVRRLEEMRPLEGGLLGLRRAVEDARAGIRRLDEARDAVVALERSVNEATGLLATGVRELDATRRADYAFARGLLALPSFDGPEIGAALFGDVSLDRMQQLVYWTTLAEGYLPPGLRPREASGPERLRLAGTTVRFPREREYPKFHLRSADLSLVASSPGSFTARVHDVTTAPALVGRPTVFAARGEGAEGGDGLRRLQITGRLDHVGAASRDLVAAHAAGIGFSGLSLPGLPFRLEPFDGTIDLRFERLGEIISADWRLRADSVTWSVDSARATSLDGMTELAWRVLSGLRKIDVTAELYGPIAKPDLTVRSNLDRALGQRLRAVAGEELARAESLARAKVDSAVAVHTAPARARVEAVRGEAQSRLDEAKRRIEEEKRKLEERLRVLGR